MEEINSHKSDEENEKNNNLLDKSQDNNEEVMDIVNEMNSKSKFGVSKSSIITFNRKKKPPEKLRFSLQIEQDDDKEKDQEDEMEKLLRKEKEDQELLTNIQENTKLIEVIACDEVHDELNDYILKDKDRRNINKNLLKNKSNFETDSEKFINIENTNYSKDNAYTKFFEKYHKYDSIQKKGIELKTPSFQFIQGVKEKRIIPNPVGLVKRQGNIEQVNIK